MKITRKLEDRVLKIICYLFNNFGHAHDSDSDETVLAREAVITHTNVKLEQIQLLCSANHAENIEKVTIDTLLEKFK